MAVQMWADSFRSPLLMCGIRLCPPPRSHSALRLFACEASNAETLIGNCLDNLKRFILEQHMARRSKRRKHESPRVFARKQTLLPSSSEHTRLQTRRKTHKEREEAASWLILVSPPTSPSLRCRVYNSIPLRSPVRIKRGKLQTATRRASRATLSGQTVWHKCFWNYQM